MLVSQCAYSIYLLLIYLLIHSMQHSPSWEVNRFSASQENSPHFMEPEGSLPHSQVLATCPYSEPARSSPYPHTHFLKIHLNIILPSTPGTPKRPHSLRFLHQNSVYASPLPNTRYMPRPSRSSRFYHTSNIGWGVQIIKLSLFNLTFRNLVRGLIWTCPLNTNVGYLAFWTYPGMDGGK